MPIAAASTVYADQFSSIQAAINAVHALGGGLVQLGIGTYTVTSSLAMYDNTILQGQGRATIIHMAGAQSYSILNVYGTTGCVVRDLQFTSTAPLFQAGRAAVWGEGVYDCLIENIYANGVDMSGIGGSFFNSRIIHNHIYAVGEHGIYLSTNSTGTIVAHNRIRNIGFEATGGNCGIKIAHGPSRCTIANNYIEAPSHEGIIIDDTAFGNLVQGNTVYGSPQRGIRVTTSGGGYNNIVENHLINSTFEGIIIESGDGNVVQGNYVNGTTGSGNAGIYIKSAATRTVVGPNHVINAVNVPDYRDDGVGTLIVAPDFSASSVVVYEDDYVLYEDGIITF